MDKKQRFCTKCHLPVHSGSCNSVDNRTSDWVCIQCGTPYLTEEQKKQTRVSTFNKFECGMCGEVKSVTDIRSFNFLSHPDYWKSRKEIRETRNKKRRNNYAKNKSVS